MRKSCRKSTKLLASDDRATAAVEFALLAPVFLLMMLGMLAYGIYFGASHSLQQIAADAARTAVAGMSEPERKKLVSDFIARNGGTYPFLQRDRISAETHDSAADPNQFVIELRYDASDLPVWSLFEGLPLPGKTIVRTSTIRLGGI